MPFDILQKHILLVVNCVADCEPQFKNHFIETCAEDGSNEAIEAALNDDEIFHVWKSAYLAQQILTGNSEIIVYGVEEYEGEDDEDADEIREDFEVGNLD